MALVRVRSKGFEFNVGANYAEAKGLTVIDAPTHDSSGRPRRPTRTNDRPIKPRTTVEEAAAKKGSKSPAKKTAGKAATTATSTDNPPSKEN